MATDKKTTKAPVATNTLPHQPLGDDTKRYCLDGGFDHPGLPGFGHA